MVEHFGFYVFTPANAYATVWVHQKQKAIPFPCYKFILSLFPPDIGVAPEDWASGGFDDC